MRLVIAFIAAIDGDTSRDSAIYSGKPGQLKLLAREGDPAPLGDDLDPDLRRDVAQRVRDGEREISTHENYERLVRRLVLPTLGRRPLGSVAA